GGRLDPGLQRRRRRFRQDLARRPVGDEAQPRRDLHRRPRAGGRSGALMAAARPSLRFERVLLREGARILVGMDEVGRGALAGPVSVGAVALDLRTRSGPRGVADSKLLTAAARTALLPALGRWGRARAVGHASPAEIDERGIVGALRLAGVRALAALETEVEQVDVVVLDGTHDWLTAPSDLLSLLEDDPAPASTPHVMTKARADRTCA